MLTPLKSDIWPQIIFHFEYLVCFYCSILWEPQGDGSKIISISDNNIVKWDLKASSSQAQVNFLFLNAIVYQWQHHRGHERHFPPKLFLPPPHLPSPQIMTNVLKLNQIWRFQHKNGKNIKFLCASQAFFHLCPPVKFSLSPFLPSSPPKCWCWCHHCCLYSDEYKVCTILSWQWWQCNLVVIVWAHFFCTYILSRIRFIHMPERAFSKLCGDIPANLKL